MRHQVEQMLGERLWRPGSAEGLTYDIYQFEADRPAEPGLSAGLLFFDILYMGMPEVTLNNARKFAPIKQVAVAYDEQDRVRLVSQPWEVPGRTVDACRRMRSVLPADSGVPLTARPSPTDRPVGAVSGIAILEFGREIRATIDGRKPEGPVVEMTPGRHTVAYQTTLGGSVMYGATLLSYDASAEVELLPGRLYRLKHERFYDYPRKRADMFWIEDTQP